MECKNCLELWCKKAILARFIERNSWKYTIHYGTASNDEKIIITYLLEMQFIEKLLMMSNSTPVQDYILSNVGEKLIGRVFH